jgi:multiple sugar transport system permease protein
MTAGGPHYATMFYVYYLYSKAFRDFDMGYASAMAWLLLIVILLITYLILKTSDKYVYYEGGKK